MSKHTFTHSIKTTATCTYIKLLAYQNCDFSSKQILQTSIENVFHIFQVLWKKDKRNDLNTIQGVNSSVGENDLISL